MEVNGVNMAAYTSDMTPYTPKTELGKDDFLKLLVTQMRYQDPLQPLDNNAYISQMAQLTALEQTYNLVASFNISRAVAMVGKTVTASYFDDITGVTHTITGEVQRAFIQQGEVYLDVAGNTVKLDSVTEVMQGAGTD